MVLNCECYNIGNNINQLKQWEHQIVLSMSALRSPINIECQEKIRNTERFICRVLIPILQVPIDKFCWYIVQLC